MAITTTVVRKTGIYQVTHTKADDQAGVRECLEGMAKWFNIDWQLEWIEEYALGVLRPQGVTAWPFQVPKDAGPLLKDASNAALRVSLVRNALADGNAKDAAINALQLGRTVERMGVRPFEPHAARGIKLFEAGRRGHEGRYGTEQEKLNRWKQMAELWHAIHQTEPDIKKSAIDDRVARRFDVSSKTVQRARLKPEVASREKTPGGDGLSEAIDNAPVADTSNGESLLPSPSLPAPPPPRVAAPPPDPV